MWAYADSVDFLKHKYYSNIASFPPCYHFTSLSTLLSWFPKRLFMSFIIFIPYLFLIFPIHSSYCKVVFKKYFRYTKGIGNNVYSCFQLLYMRNKNTYDCVPLVILFLHSGCNYYKYRYLLSSWLWYL